MVLDLSGAPSTAAQPAHIHQGTCAKIDLKPKWNLESLVNGRSTAIVAATMSEIMKGDTAINVHKSGEDMKTCVACGDIK